MPRMNVRLTAVVLLILAVASAAQDKPEKPKKPKKIPTKKRLEILEQHVAALNQTNHDLTEAIDAMAKLQAEQHDEVMETQNKIINLLNKDDSCLDTTPAACPQPTTSSLGGAACDVTTEGGPWTVVQRRTVGDVLFNMSWADYKVGFGSQEGDHWIGNDALNELCPPARPCQLRVEVTWPGQPWYISILPTQPDGVYTALYGRFAVADAADLYRLTVGQFNRTASTAGDDLRYHHGYAFSTVDADHDTWDRSCSANNGGAGWWFSNCGDGLNGQWAARYGKGPIWHPVSFRDSVTATRMLVRPAA